MRTKQADSATQRPSPVHDLEDPYCKAVRGLYEAIYGSSLNKFTRAQIDAWCGELNGIVYELDRKPEISFVKLMGVIQLLRQARNELYLARFLFEVEEIQPLHRFVMRNRAVLRGERILNKALQAWRVPA